MIRSFLVDSIGIDFSSEGSDFGLILIDSEPSVNHRFVDFKMKLKTVDAGAVPKSLVGA